MLNCFDTPSFTFQIRARPIMGIEIQILTQKASCFNVGYGKISSIIAMVKGSSCDLILIQTYICKCSKPEARPEHLWNGQTKFQKFQRNLQTEIHFSARFKVFSWSKHIPNTPKNLLQSQTSSNTQRIAHHSPTVCQTCP